MEEALAHANTAFTALFTIELVFKAAALGPWAYVCDAWNAFDAAVVAVSLLEVALVTASGASALG